MKKNRLRVYLSIVGVIICFSYIGSIQPITDLLTFKVFSGLVNTLPVFIFYKIMRSYIGLWENLNTLKKISLVSLAVIMVFLPIFIAIYVFLNIMNAMSSSSTGGIALLAFPIIPIFIQFLALLPYIILKWDSN